MTQKSPQTCERASKKSLPRAIYAPSAGHLATTHSTAAVLKFASKGKFYSTVQAMISHGCRWAGRILEITKWGLQELWPYSVGPAEEHSFQVCHVMPGIFQDMWWVPVLCTGSAIYKSCPKGLLSLSNGFSQADVIQYHYVVWVCSWRLSGH